MKKLNYLRRYLFFFLPHCSSLFSVVVVAPAAAVASDTFECYSRGGVGVVGGGGDGRCSGIVAADLFVFLTFDFVRLY